MQNLRWKYGLVLAMLLILVPGHTAAQKFLYFETYDVDSILGIIPHQQGNEKINSLNRIAKSLSFVDFDSSMLYANEAMQLATSLRYDFEKAAAFRNYGHIYQYHGDYPEALKNYMNAAALYDSLGMDYELAKVYFDISQTHYFAANYQKSFEYDDLAMSIFRKKKKDGTTIGGLRDTLIIIAARSLLDLLTGDMDQSIEKTMIYLRTGTRNNFDKTDLCLITVVAAERFYGGGKRDSAIFYLKEALAYPDLNPSIEALKYRAVTFLGHINYWEENYEQALSQYLKAYRFYKSTGFLSWATSLSNTIGATYLKTGKPEMARSQLRQSEELFTEMMNKQSWYRYDSLKNVTSWGLELYVPLPKEQQIRMVWQDGVTLYKLLFEVNNRLDNKEEALKYHIEFKKAADSLDKFLRNRELIELETRYETARNEEKIAALSRRSELQELRLNQTRYLLYGLIIVVVLVLIIALLLRRQENLKTVQQTLLLKQQLFRSQLNPHFLFNSLASIHNFMMTEKPQKAATYLNRFSKLMRSILNSSLEEYIPLEEEINMVQNYLELQKVRYKNKFKYSVELDKGIDPTEQSIPSMLTQPFIENAIEHGVKPKQSKGTIRVRFMKSKKALIIEIEDDGIGRKKARELQPNKQSVHRSLSTSIIQDRIQVLNKTLKHKIILEIQDLVDGSNKPSGTLVRIELPVN